MSTTSSDQEIVAILAEKIGAVLKNAEYDDNGKIVKLNLSGLNLSQVPIELGQLTNLQRLDLHSNKLSQLPVELGQLTNLQELRIDDNLSLLTPPPEIVARGTTEMLTFLRGLQEKSVIRYEAKLLVVGEGGTGKSSLLRALRNETFAPNLSTTHGIEVATIELSHPNQTHLRITLNTWDFGGQQIYHATHQFFLTERSLYMVAWNARLGAEQGKLHYWLDTIKALAPKAPVLLVATHIDERAPDLNYQSYEEEYPQLIGYLRVSNVKGTGITELKAVLTEQAMQLPLMGQLWPQKWLKAEEMLMALPEHHIDADTYTHMCSTCEIEADVAQGTLGNYLHDLGKILYFRNDYVLSNLVVLKPNWITKAISFVLEDEATRAAHGILLHAKLPHIWATDEEGRPYEHHLYPCFLRLMERFDLSHQIEADQPEDHSICSLIPQLLPYQPPIILPPWPKTPVNGQTQVEMIYRLNFVPQGIMSWFIVRTYRYTQNLHWREGVILVYEKHQARVELHPTRRELRLNTINLILHRFKGLDIQREVPCICHWQRDTAEPCTRFYRYEDLIRRMEAGKHQVECPDTFVNVAVPALLYGIHPSTDEKVMADIKQGQQEIQKKLVDLQKLDILLEKVDQQSELIGRNFTRQWNLEMEKMEAECPNIFFLIPGSGLRFNPKN